MPDFDTGHLFLTFLTPIRDSRTKDPFGTVVSCRQNLRSVLNLLPTALQSPATQEIGVNSPFARSLQTHLCRFVIIDDVTHNGRDPQNAIATSITGGDPIHPRPVDRLRCSYLLFAADIDAVASEGDPLPARLGTAAQAQRRDAYLRRLWDRMAPELRDIYDNCHGFQAVRTGADFAAYMARCQIETTLPFNDYAIAPLPMKVLPVRALAAGVLLPLALTLLAGLSWLWGADTVPLIAMVADWSPGITAALGGLLTLAAAATGLYLLAGASAAPMPPARHGDLPSVLKSLYLQQQFADFAVRAQAMGDEEMHAAFGAWLAEHRPEDRMAPTQSPGVVSVASPGGVTRVVSR